MVIFHSFILVYQAGYISSDRCMPMGSIVADPYITILSQAEPPCDPDDHPTDLPGLVNCHILPWKDHHHAIFMGK